MALASRPHATDRVVLGSDTDPEAHTEASDQIHNFLRDWFVALYGTEAFEKAFVPQTQITISKGARSKCLFSR